VVAGERSRRVTYEDWPWHQLAPGVYVGTTDVLHLVIPELLEANGLPATPENVERMTEQAHTLIESGAIVWVEEPPPA
jgi:hypothetical protein